MNHIVFPVTLPVVYILRGAESKPLYVGATKNIMRRLGSHYSTNERGKNLGVLLVEIIPCGSLDEAVELEGRLIEQLDPPYNKHGSYRLNYSAIPKGKEVNS
jgi:DNA polymerase-3 subunit epsilon